MAPAAVLPLQQLKRRMGPLTVRELRLVNHGHMTLADVCADRRDTTLWPELWRWLHGRQAPDWDRLVVTHTPADGVLAGWMQQQPPAHLLQSVASSSARVDCREKMPGLGLQGQHLGGPGISVVAQLFQLEFASGRQ